MKSQPETTTTLSKTGARLTREQVEVLWRNLDKYREKLRGVDLSQIIIQDRLR